jgi:asparagine synthase (glutamine-hydrolysing)
MCGIAGLIDYSGQIPIPGIAALMCGTIAHRGPDGEGVLCKNNAAIAHRRLSIIDLEGGRQPMSTPDGQLHLTYNGEIYNYEDLRRELEKRGCRFRTSSDTEVVLYAYQEWGRACVERFEGMFAFAILDLRKREMLLARDHFGIKPLLYRMVPGSFSFASEFQAFKTLPDWNGEIDLSAVDLFLRYQYIPAPQTVWRNVFKLPAGHRMVVGLDEPRISIERYWKPDFTRKTRRRPAQLLEELDFCLRDSVRRHLVSDVPFGAFLSGGIDSSLVVGYMAELLGRPVQTFSIGFDDSQFSEVQYARQVAQKYRTEHHEQILNVDAFAALPEIVRHYGEPYGDQSAIATWALCRLARTRVPMALSGDGGDELFAGYGTYGAWLSRCPSQTVPGPLQRAKTLARGLRNTVLRRPVRRSSPRSASVEDWFPVTGRFHDTLLRSQLWRAELRFVSDLPGQKFQQAFSESAGLSTINKAQWLDLQTFLPEDILTKVDVASMSVGLEVRPPILDRRVFQLAASIPETELWQDDRGYCGKLALKELAAARFGHEFAFRRKQGFEIPLERWLRGTEQRRDEVAQQLLDPRCGLVNWFCPEQLQLAVSSGTVYNLWLLCVLREWRQQNAS